MVNTTGLYNITRKRLQNKWKLETEEEKQQFIEI